MGNKKLDFGPEYDKLPASTGPKGNLSPRKKRQEKDYKLTPKQIRARARRAGGLENLSDREIQALKKTMKPIEQWDLEELARGRPRDKNGGWTGRAPSWVTREWHEKAVNQFKQRIRMDMQSHTIVAVDTLLELLNDNTEDNRGRLRVTPSTKADIAKFLIEHLLGKPKQPIEADINLKLQGILGAALVMPDQLGGYQASSSHRELEGVVDAELEDDDDSD